MESSHCCAGTVPLRARLADGRAFNLSCRPNDAVETTRERVAELAGISASTALPRILFRGQILRDGGSPACRTSSAPTYFANPSKSRSIFSTPYPFPALSSSQARAWPTTLASLSPVPPSTSSLQPPPLPPPPPPPPTAARLTGARRTRGGTAGGTCWIRRPSSRCRAAPAAAVGPRDP